MSETREIKEILEELFKGQDAAINKYARVRITQYEIDLWKKHGLPLNELSRQEKLYFSKRFLQGRKISEISPAELEKAILTLDHAVNDGCHGRCIKLVKELNEALARRSLKTVGEPEKFLNWLTFDYQTIKDYKGDNVKEANYGYEIRLFESDNNRKEFWQELKSVLAQGRIMSMQDIAKIVLFKRKHGKNLKTS